MIQKILIVAHRGASGYEPENTLRSFKKAIDLGADMVELDVYLCRSGEVVVIHDDTIERTTNGTGKVKELLWEELQKYDAGMGERIPRLSDVLDLVDKKMAINIELKDPGSIRPVAELIKEYIAKKSWAPAQFLVSSFDHQAVYAFHAYCPEVATGLIFEDSAQDSIKIVQHAHARYAIMDHNSITPQFVNKAHQHDIRVFAYTVNDRNQALMLKKVHIDGIITNYPDILRD